MATLLDNKAEKTVGKALTDHIHPEARLSVAVNRFSVFGYAALKKQLDRIDGLRLLLPTGVPGAPEVVSMSALAGNEAERRFRNTLNLAFVARQCAAWLEKKTKMRAVSQPIPQNLYHVENPDGRSIAVHGSSPLTSDGLGVVPSESFEMNTLFSTPAETESLRGWFDAIWNGPGISKSIQSAVLKLLKQIGSDQPPERMYFFTLSRLLALVQLNGTVHQGAVGIIKSSSQESAPSRIPMETAGICFVVKCSRMKL